MNQSSPLQRIDKLKAWINRENIETLLIDDPVDLFYLTNLTLSLGVLLVSSEGATLFVDGRYISSAKVGAPCEVLPLETLKEQAISRGAIAFDSAFVSFDRYLDLQRLFPKIPLIPISKPLKALRGVKEPEEIEKLKRAQALTRAGFEYITELLKEGVSEEELAFEFEVFCRKKGASKLSFSPIVAFGKNSAFPHHRSGKDRLEKDQVVLFDLGCIIDGYAGDMTRVVFFGKPDETIEKDYALVKRAQEKAIALAAPGVPFGKLDKLVRKELEEAGVLSLFTHGLSHGIGLDVHEYPRLKIGGGGDVDLILEPGMAFTVEPGIYREGLGGVRYEDVVIITQDGHETI